MFCLKILLALSPLAVPSYIQPPLANHIDAPMPLKTGSDCVVGIYGNILYPQDEEQRLQHRLLGWVEDGSAPFPLSQDELNRLSLYILDRFPMGALSEYFFNQVQMARAEGESFEHAVQKGLRDAVARAERYQVLAEQIPAREGRGKRLKGHFSACIAQLEEMIERETMALRKASLNEFKHSYEPIREPFTWETRLSVFTQMIEKILSKSPDSPYFLALQEVTPEALHDFKRTLKGRDLQWISFNNISGQETAEPGQETTLGESTGFTSTIALSSDLEVLKVELGDLPTESGSVRKILGIRVRNVHTNVCYTLFTTHTDHKIQNGIYERSAAKIHEFARGFFHEDARFVLGGDLNAFEELGGAAYLESLRTLFPGSKDFRETDYYAPRPIASSSFIGHNDDAYSGRIAIDGVMVPNAFDHILVGGDIELEGASREAAVYNFEGELLDYDEQRDEYVESLQKRITFSDHFFNVVRFK